MIPQLLEMFERHPNYFRHDEKVRIDVLRRFGYYCTEKQRSPERIPALVPQARRTRSAQWIDISSWINGETGGYLRVCTEGRNWFETDFPQLAGRSPPSLRLRSVARSTARTSSRRWRPGASTGAISTSSTSGHITNLPNGCIIEIPGYVDKNGINMPVIGDLPLACAATCSASVRVQQMGMEAAVHGDVTLLKQAMLHDPLVGAVCNPEEVWQMTDEMLVAQAKWLPQNIKRPFQPHSNACKKRNRMARV